MTEALLYEQDGGIVTLTINRPEERNALSDDIIFDAFLNAADRINKDNSVRCVILTGAGKAFSAGGNVKHMRDKEGLFAGSPAELRQGYRHGIQKIPLSFYDLEVPTIAAVNGPAVGAGCDLACMCDIRIAGKSARFAESFVKLGIIPGDGGAWFLPRLIGKSRAAELTFTGDMIDAPTALDWGLVSSVVEDADLMTAATDLAKRIAANPPHALRMAKKLLREGEHMRLDSLLEMSAAFQALSHHAKDHDEAITAFFEKRPGNFKGE
ncbi:crotonase/enoyl-CoA hydratase family protein [Sneathiella sp.]|uniref:crotonase/enoyl-CoA hydratase family protein n=1 Tax=Sneathiella sp. TaxID=1964365 RepID=UPI00262635E5|nr:crotonase/enoyl-CoA hydratase family protein [Sneathiella sp.]MDF2367826.1 crotonase/enoyl-CoA hydratase family protein [Sneathiella sp.]